MECYIDFNHLSLNTIFLRTGHTSFKIWYETDKQIISLLLGAILFHRYYRVAVIFLAETTNGVVSVSYSIKWYKLNNYHFGLFIKNIGAETAVCFLCRDVFLSAHYDDVIKRKHFRVTGPLCR